MKKSYLILIGLLLSLSLQVYADEKRKIPDSDKWEKTNERDISSPQLYQDDSSVYVYSEKQLDNVTIGITDMQGNTYHYEVTTIPACTYYAVSIDSLPSGQYYLCVYLGWGGTNDGWYRSNAYNPHAPNNSYTYNQKIILVRK